jgi:hypothetical protein
MVLTAVKGSNGKRLRVRCKCMAECPNVKDNYYNYDPIGDVNNLEEAITVYDEHLRNS